MDNITILILILVAFFLFAAYRFNLTGDAIRASLEAQKQRNEILARIAVALEKIVASK